MSPLTKHDTGQLSSSTSATSPADEGRDWKRLAEIWLSQIESARSQTNTAIIGLTREFAGIVENLDELAGLARDIERNEGRLMQAVNHAAGQDDPGVVGHLARSAEKLDQRSTLIRTNVEASLVHLQFQDRINQILGHVQANILALTKALAEREAIRERTGSTAPIDFAALLREMESSYTMPEERANHRHLPNQEADDEITFF